MSLERWLFGSVIYPAYHTLKRDAVLRHIAEYERNQWLSPHHIAEIQARKLNALVGHATTRVPYYRQLTRGPVNGSFGLKELSQLPPLTKAIIRKEGRALLAENACESDLESNSTSGSTGEPLYFFTDQRSSDCRKASVVRNGRWAGIDLGDREIRLWGSPIDIKKSQALRGRLHGWLTRSRLISAYDLSRESLREYLRIINAFQPQLLISYPSVLEELTLEARRSGIRVKSPRAIIVSAEMTYPHQRDLFESVLGSPVFNRYGSREVGDIAQECEVHDELHVNADRILVEIVRPDLAPCEADEVGDVLITDLDNYGMPLIRYAIGDRAALSRRDSCACGRGLPLIARIEGRSLDIVRFPNGAAVGGTYWTILLRTRPGISQFQVVQKSPREVTIRYVSEHPLGAELLDVVKRDVEKRAGPGFQVIFERVSVIPRNAAGKRRLVTSEV